VSIECSCSLARSLASCLFAQGPSEGALGVLKNGTLMAVMRCDGQSGHYLPYISKLSDDGGLTWHSLRFLRGGGSGGTQGAGCVRPRLLELNGSLVLAGGRPSPLSRCETQSNSLWQSFV
jgi:hypothetical protein